MRFSMKYNITFLKDAFPFAKEDIALVESDVNVTFNQCSVFFLHVPRRFSAR